MNHLGLLWAHLKRLMLLFCLIGLQALIAPNMAQAETAAYPGPVLKRLFDLSRAHLPPRIREMAEIGETALAQIEPGPILQRLYALAATEAGIAEPPVSTGLVKPASAISPDTSQPVPPPLPPVPAALLDPVQLLPEGELDDEMLLPVSDGGYHFDCPPGQGYCGGGTYCCPYGWGCARDGQWCIRPGHTYCGRGNSCNSGYKCSNGGGCVPRNSVDCGGGRWCQSGSYCLTGNLCSAVGATKCRDGNVCNPGSKCASTG